MSCVTKALLLIVPGLLWSTVACDGSTAGAVPLQPAQDTLRVTVHWNDTAQTLHGFGASDAWSIQHVGLWADPIRRGIAERLFSIEADGEGRPRGIGLSIWRFNIGAGSAEQGEASGIGSPWRRADGFLRADLTYDWSRQAGQQWFLRAARDYGVPTLIGFVNSPPVELTRNGLAYGDGRGGANLAPERYDDFATFLTTVAAHFAGEGLPFDHLSPFNEPQWDWSRGNNQEGSPYTNDEIVALTGVLDRHLTEAGLETRIEIPEAARIDFLYADDTGLPMRDDQLRELFGHARLQDLPRVAPKVAAHSYFTTWPVQSMIESRRRLRESLDRTDTGLEYWMSEYCILADNEEIRGPGRDLGMDPALWVARLIHFDLAVAGAAAWQWWLAVSPYDYKDGLVYVDRDTREVHDSKLLWALGNYSRFLRPGSVRVRTARSDEASDLDQARGLMVSAYRAADGVRPVVVAVNHSPVDTPVQLEVVGRAGPGPVGWQPYVTSDAFDLVPVERVEPGGTVVVPARSVVTLVGAGR
jgi:hypothetical protein